MSMNTNQYIKFPDCITNSCKTVLDRITDYGRGQDDYMIDIRLQQQSWSQQRSCVEIECIYTRLMPPLHYISTQNHQVKPIIITRFEINTDFSTLKSTAEKAVQYIDNLIIKYIWIFKTAICNFFCLNKQNRLLSKYIINIAASSNYRFKVTDCSFKFK